ncbi:hypothetical protein [Peribacillus asahii]|uniref:hypothetical protein n=1 Tax=Peribacillus asahii TaxID=228899 RepID=UPI00382E9958
MWFRKREKKFMFHEDREAAFDPLVEFLSDTFNNELDFDKTIEQYMYMCHDEEKTYYKHFGNREYFNIYHDGSTEGELEDWRKW